MLISKNNLIRYLPGTAWFFLLLYFICMPSSNIPPLDTWFNKLKPDKWVHAILFGILAYLFIKAINKGNFTLNEKNNWALKILIATIIWGLTTEFIQKYFIPGRFFDWWDWLADTVGAIIAYFKAKKVIAKSNTSQ
jgi:hypothetical protein